MAAFNWIEFQATCPACSRECVVRAQCHVASSYDGDDAGRFHDRSYGLMQAMRWWPPSDPRWSGWREGGHAIDEAGDGAVECCYANCGRCGADLFAIIRFASRVPREWIRLGLEEDWPADFSR